MPQVNLSKKPCLITIKRIFFFLLCLAFLFLASCKEREQSPLARKTKVPSVMTEPALFYFKKNRGFFFDNRGFENTVFYTDRGSVFPICEQSANWAASCRISAEHVFFVKPSEISRIEGSGPLPAWLLKFIEVRENRLNLYFVPPPVVTLDESIHPIFWIESTPDSEEFFVHLTPVEAGVQLYNHDYSSPLISSVRWEADRLSVKLTVKGKRFLALNPVWEQPYKLSLMLQDRFPERPRIVLDPGHGGSDPGTTDEIFAEKDKTLEAALVLKSKLEAANCEVLLTRDKDITLSLEDRVRFAEKNNANLLISLHIDNWQGSVMLPEVPLGLSCYYSSWFSKAIAERLCRSVLERGYRSSWYTKRQLYVLHSMRYPSVLLELVNRSDAKDKSLLGNKERFEAYLNVLAEQTLSIVRNEESF